MNRSLQRCWIEYQDGARLIIPAEGLSIGRSTANDVVLSSSRASSRHALIRLRPEGPVLHPTGRNPTKVNGEEIDTQTALQHGDIVDLPGTSITIGVEKHTERRGPNWLLERRGGGAFGLLRSPFIVGGGDTDDLCLKTLMPAAITLLQVDGKLFLELATQAWVGEETCPPGYFDEVYPGTVVEIGDEHLTLFAGQRGRSDATIDEASLDLPTAVRLTFLPEGARLQLTFRDRDITLDLADRRSRLLAAILKPATGYLPGDFVPDDQLISQIWPRQKEKGRTDVNLLLYRVRKQMVKGGVSGHRILERSRLGNATRFVLSPGATVEVG